ncbi:MAG: FKBP-type peptidyl-prolyl cis-trans isomerase [Prevotella sp.]|nr:FKBP-type peptidyl-prolyl cis-trans isomerase [Prevotella sp.]
MKRIILLALVIVASATTTTLVAKDKKDKKKKKTPAVQVVAPVTPADSASFAAGYATTDGLMGYLTRQLGVDTAYMADFIDGLREAIAQTGDPKFTARSAGYQIAETISKRIFPSQKQKYGEEGDTISAKFFNEGFMAALTNDSTVFNLKGARDYFDTKVEERTNARNAAWDRENREWLMDNAQKEGVVTLPSGLQYKIIKQGTGAQPTATDKVVVKYEGKMIDGTVFDSSYTRKPDTTSFRCDQVIKGWTEALTLMPVGSTWEFYIPQELAYGSRQAGKIKPLSTLIFKVELIDIETEKEKAK